MSIARKFLRDEKIIYRILHGSHLYGTNTETSDRDYKEVYIPSGEAILLNRVKEARSEGPDKPASEKNQPGDIDTQSFAISKLFKMITAGDIIGCEMIFTPPQNIILKHKAYDAILENKHIFLSRKVDGYVGYCRTQANKYGIRGSRIAAVRGLLDLLKSFSNSSVRLKEHWDVLTGYCLSTLHCEVLQIANGGMGTVTPHIECCSKKVPWTIMVKDAIKIYQHYFDNYGHRALLAEKNEGIDWKAMSHAVRVGWQAVELLDTGNIEFPRPEAEMLLRIKRGEIAYTEVSEALDQLLLLVEAKSVSSQLPPEPDLAAVDELLLEMHRMMV